MGLFVGVVAAGAASSDLAIRPNGMEASPGPGFWSSSQPTTRRFLPRLLESIDAAREIYGGGPSAIKVIVTGNVSTDSTASVAALHGC
jgi:hypothetical protein